MLQDQQYLRIPGPTPIPPSVERAMAKPMVGHRASVTDDLLKKIQPGLRKVFGTDQDVLIVAGSGTAGLEAAAVNTVRRGEEAIVIVSGSFGARFEKICLAHGIIVHRYETEWGEAFEPEVVRGMLEEHPGVKAVFSTYCETSTGVVNPVAELARVVREVSDALIIADGVSIIGGVEAKMDEWGLDVLVTGSQKAMMLPPGLMFAAVSDRAWNVIEANPDRGFYLDLVQYRDSIRENTTPFTPAVSLLYGLDQALTLLEEEGIAEVAARHELMRDMIRAAFRAHGIPLLTSDEAGSPTVTAVRPDDFDAEGFRSLIHREFGLAVASGQGKLEGKIFRVGHMGYCSPGDVLQMIALFELGIARAGKQIETGKGVAAAQRVYLQKGEQTK
ncbi:pyridoxal-phosphate-dependent aminotransferase family protein [Bhargavaea cecembensis]|uniref:pyridoxal-phosphate-dependent aminotransferase family protein n=1 Tax=Bhargavaea cecembensis TaxID=394098 RepID=UPI00058D926F|nr:alanine--glyoxylate aminotransferase family protein [Bhargavaea cecembensis]